MLLRIQRYTTRNCFKWLVGFHWIRTSQTLPCRAHPLLVAHDASHGRDFVHEMPRHAHNYHPLAAVIQSRWLNTVRPRPLVTATTQPSHPAAQEGSLEKTFHLYFSSFTSNQDYRGEDIRNVLKLKVLLEGIWMVSAFGWEAITQFPPELWDITGVPAAWHLSIFYSSPTYY